MNRDWHLTHLMPPAATLDQRINWHLAHAANCGCRDIPESLRLEIEARGLVIPKPRSVK
jgi:hypothetical protein